MTRILRFAVISTLMACSAQLHAQSPLFTPASPVLVGPGSGQIVLADVNRDGHLDLLTQHLLHRRLAVQLGDGKGNFAPLVRSSMSLSYEPAAMVIGDVNHDSIPDLVHAFPAHSSGALGDRSWLRSQRTARVRTSP